jgi:DNA-binding transcriptional LysR family regulator
VLDDLRKGIADIDFLSDPTSGEIRIGCSEPVAVGIVHDVIGELSASCRRLTFQVEVRPPELVFEELAARKLDLAVTQIFGWLGNDQLQTEILYDDPVGIVASRRNPLAAKRKVNLTMLARERWVLPPGESFITRTLMQAFHAQGLDVTAAVTTHSVFLRLMLAASGRFLTIVPLEMLKGMRQLSIKALPVELPDNRRPVAIITVKGRSLSPAAEFFIAHARAAFAGRARGRLGLGLQSRDTVLRSSRARCK